MKNRLASIMLVSLLVIGGFVGLIHFGSENAKATDVSGIISTDTTWGLAGSPYIVVGHVTVESGVTLTIDPGVQVKFDGFYSIYVDGTIIAIGTKTDQITITSNKASPAPRDWQSIRVTSTGHVEIKYCDISYSAFGIYLYPSSNNTITKNTISYSGNGIFVRESSNNNTITHNNILNNEYGIQVRESSNNNIITHNNISNNYIGIFLWYSLNTIITNNNFINDGINIIGDNLSHFNSHTIPDNNIVNSKPLYYYKDRSGINIDGIPVGQLILANCTDFDVKNLQINNADMGIEVAYSTNISISNNNISSNLVDGIDFYSSWNNKIIGNNITNNGWGIDLSSSSNSNIIANNNISSNTYVSIGIGSSNNNIITNNNILSNNDYGVNIGGNWEDNSSNNIVTGNNIANHIVGIHIPWASNNIISNNNISNNSYGITVRSPNGIVLPHNNVITGNTISGNIIGCYLEDTYNNIIANNNISNNGDGINFRASSSNEIRGNTISSNDNNGIYSWMSANNVTNNDISDNLYGIHLVRVVANKYNIIRNNNISNNDYGIYINWTFDNVIYHNNFINNTNQAYDNTNNRNQWDNGYPSGGNFWSDYNGVDLNSTPSQDVPPPDGIGDTPYIIDSDSQDNYPLMDLIINRTFLYEGWNLISIPFIQPDTNLGIVLDSIKGSYNAVQWYNVSDTLDHWKHNHISKQSHLNDLKSIDHTISFWIHITEPGGVLFEYSGIQPIVNQSIPLHPGWNLVGYPSLTNKDRTAALNNIDFPNDVDAIWTFNSITQKWEEMGSSDYFELGRGYWVHSKVEKVWDVPI